MTKKLLLFALIAMLGLSDAIGQKKIKVHTIGDSTMADYVENTTRTRGWGEMLQEFFSDEVEVVNYARGGRSSRSFFEEGRWNTVKENLAPGDYVFIQFAHNDEKEKGKDGADFRGTAPWTTYKSFIERYVDETRSSGGIPVLITPIVRRYFDNAGKITPKGCHDISENSNDSILNYVRVMKHVARQKKVDLVDITALTKRFVEELGEEKTVNCIYVPTDGTHTQATGAAYYAKLVVDELKKQKILASYIKNDIPMVLNPVSLDFGTVYVGDNATLCFDLTAIHLLPERGTLSIVPPPGMRLSSTPHSPSQPRLDITYADNKLWNQCYYLHFNPKVSGNIASNIIITNGSQKREIPVKGVSKEISRKENITKEFTQKNLKGLKDTDSGITIETGDWPTDIDEASNRYIEFIVSNNKEKTLVVQQLFFTLKGKLSYRIAYAFGKDFYPRTDIGENRNENDDIENVAFPMNVTLKPEERLHIRIFPWSASGGDMTFKIEDWKVSGIELE